MDAPSSRAAALILVDARAGSKELAKPLRGLGLDVPDPLPTLMYGDVSFEGRGADATSVSVGVEFKTLGDLIASIRSGRLTGPREAGTMGQLHGMVASYDYAWLMIEGSWRADEKGRIVAYQGPKRGWQVAPGGMSATELDKHLLTFELCAGTHVWRTASRPDSIRAIASLYRWWTDRALDQHVSHLAPHRPQTMTPLSSFRQAVMAWPGVGLQMSLAAEAHFLVKGRPSIRRAASADTLEWASLQTMDSRGKTRRFGESAAQKVLRFLTTGE